uniref:Uncharacterized protein n=1 Tax=Mucochytrium quahogii TaxID=96639 RepID=A0A7S2RA78_9STRA|mmetsp:Transcript_4325/g.6414  ORF Transcript_4325/g.6414 Transcript_4325/m.6414 type:complete len:103 (+) Transcript_4325:227-535(+)
MDKLDVANSLNVTHELTEREQRESMARIYVFVGLTVLGLASLLVFLYRKARKEEGFEHPGKYTVAEVMNPEGDEIPGSHVVNLDEIASAKLDTGRRTSFDHI